MNIYIPAVKEGYLDKKYGILTDDKDIIKCGIPRKSFEIKWDNLPEGTQSIAFIYIDYDNAEDEGVPWIHWLAADIPAEWGIFAENKAEDGIGFVQGRNSWSIPYPPYDDIDEELTIGFGGPAPNRCHEYELHVYALDDYLKLERGFYLNQLRTAMENHILDVKVVKMKYIGG